MTSQSFATAGELRHAITEGRISDHALQTITGIPPERLQPFLAEGESAGLASKPPALADDEGARLSVLASQIIQGLEIDDDERLQAILEGLTIQFHLTLENIARLTRASIADLEAALRDPGSVPPERKYPIALRVSYLNLAIANARPSSTPSGGGGDAAR